MQKSTFDAENTIWRGSKINPLYNPDQSLGFLILNILQQTPDVITQISADTDVSVTCKQMHDRTIKIAKYLTKCGMKEGDLVGFVASNTENLAPIVYACFTLGLPINPLAPLMNESDIIQMFSKTNPKMIFCDAENLKVVQNAVNEMKSSVKIYTVMDKVDGYECVTQILKEMDGEVVRDFVIPSINPNTIAMVLCSSGSTGSPKGVCKSHKQFIYNFRPFFNQNLDKSFVIFQSSLIFWFSGIYFMVISALFKCVRIIIAQPIEPNVVAKIVHKYNVNAIMLPPYDVSKILQIPNLQPFSSISEWTISGSQLSKDLLARFEKFIPNGIVSNSYGCSEQDFLALNKENSKQGSCGVPFNNVEMKIIDDGGKSLGPNEKGEICTKIPIQFSGYFGEPEMTSQAFDAEWFKTGDIGYFDDDGYLYVVDRKKQLLKYNNYQVTPSEIETIIHEIKGIVISSVVGVPEEDTGNDIIHAFVIVDGSCDLYENFILDYVNAKVSEPKKIRGGVHIVESFPMTFSGKVSKIELRKIASQFKTA